MSDENDVAPKFTRKEWNVEVPEGQPPDTVLNHFSIIDPDTHNDFEYRVSMTLKILFFKKRLFPHIRIKHKFLIL